MKVLSLGLKVLFNPPSAYCVMILSSNLELEIPIYFFFPKMLQKEDQPNTRSYVDFTLGRALFRVGQWVQLLALAKFENLKIDCNFCLHKYKYKLLTCFDSHWHFGFLIFLSQNTIICTWMSRRKKNLK